MKTFQTFIGIDISKPSLDVSVIHWKGPNKAIYYKVGNDGKGIGKLLGQLSKSGAVLQDTLFVVVSFPFLVRLKSRFFY